MSMSAYRIKNSITAVILRGARERFQCLTGGSILIPTSGPDAAGLIEAKYEDDLVLVFKRDLTEACERIEIEAASREGPPMDSGIDALGESISALET